MAKRHSSGFFHTFDSFKLEGNTNGRKIHVLVPRDYESSNDKYPVLYFNDGNTTFWPGGLGNKSWQIAESLSKIGKSKVIVVAIHPIDREYEYTHTYWLPLRKYGGLDDYANYLVKLKGNFLN